MSRLGLLVALAAATILIAATPMTPELAVNQTTSGDQNSVSTAMAPGGGSVVAWASLHYEGDIPWAGIYGRRYDAAGNPLTGELPLATGNFASFNEPQVAMDAAGNFVVVYQSEDASGLGIWARRFDAAGTPVAPPFAVNATTAGEQTRPQIGIDGDGDFVVAWESTDADGLGVVARRFDGGAGGPEIPVNVTTAGDQGDPGIGVASDGSFVVAWEAGAAEEDIVARRFGPTGAPTSGEFTANATTAGDQDDVAVAMDPSGRFAIAWESLGQDGSDEGVYFRTFSAAGAPLTGDVLANATTAGEQAGPAIAMDAAGRPALAWFSAGQDGDGDAVIGRQFTLEGAPVTAELAVNTHTPDDQDGPAVASDGDGDLIFAWESTGQDGSGDGVYARFFGEPDAQPQPPDPTPQPPAPTPTPPPTPPAQQALPAVKEVIRFPAAKRCVSRRAFRIRLARKALKGLKIRAVEVTLNGRRLPVLRGRRITSFVSLKGLPKGRVTVRITVRLADGRKLTGKRRYRTCARKRKGGRVPL